MEITISEVLLKRIQWKVDSGIYGSPDEVVENALDLLDQRDVSVAMVRDLVQEGIDDIEAGRYKTYSEETLENLVDDVKRRALGRLESQKKTPTN